MSRAELSDRMKYPVHQLCLGARSISSSAATAMYALDQICLSVTFINQTYCSTLNKPRVVLEGTLDVRDRALPKEGLHGADKSDSFKAEGCAGD